MDFTIPAELEAYLVELDQFIDAEIKPLEQQDDNIRFFDHRREYARTDFENDGLPRHEWEMLLREASLRADKAGHWRFSAPKKYGGKDGSNLAMAVIRDRFAAKGLGLPIVNLALGATLKRSLDGLRRSDHAPFWDADYPALMITDTANFRNPHYHCPGSSSDALADIDFDFAISNVKVIVGAALAELDR